ncbi:hypothetical protein Sm713_66050 [Streptomyces sp. TS71-3]|nr:hypothetical protein Sm713_66050 [Streptomyces sp. TS71-3]
MTTGVLRGSPAGPPAAEGVPAVAADEEGAAEAEPASGPAATAVPTTPAAASMPRLDRYEVNNCSSLDMWNTLLPAAERYATGG